MSFSGYLHRDPDYRSLPNQVDEELLRDRVQKLRSGDLSVANDISISLMRLVMGVVRDTNSYDDEVIGEALATLHESVLKAATALTDDNIIPYVLYTIRMRLKDVSSQSWIMSARRVRERLSKSLLCPQRRPITQEKKPEQGEFTDPKSEIAAYEIRDLLENMVRSLRQKDVIELRMQNYTLKEIAQQLEISEATAMRELHDLRDRYEF